MELRKAHRVSDYALAAVAVAIAGFLRILLQPALGHEYEFTTLFLAIVLAAWNGGFGPGIFALVLDCVVAGAIHGFRNESVLPANANDAVGLFLYIIMGISVSMLGEGQRQSLRDLTFESAHKESLIGQLAKEVALRETTQNQLRLSQEQLLKANASLEERVAERTNELTMAMNELESFTYSMAHDMRAPLRAVNATCRLMAEEHGLKADPAGRDLLNSAMRAAEFMNSFVDDLLDFARLARAPIRKRKLNLTDILVSISEDIFEVERDAQIQIQPEMEVISDPVLTVSLFRELVDNARKFKRPDAPCRVQVDLESRDDSDVITVSDLGIGFEPEYAAKIFEPFQKLHSTSKYEGTGIGLAKAKRIVERLGGIIWAESELGYGAKFFVAFPHRLQFISRRVEEETLQLMVGVSH